MIMLFGGLSMNCHSTFKALKRTSNTLVSWKDILRDRVFKYDKVIHDFTAN